MRVLAGAGCKTELRNPPRRTLPKDSDKWKKKKPDFCEMTIALAVGLPMLGLLVGSPAPNFAATSHTNKNVALSDFRDQKVLLWFYPRASTGG